MGNFCRFRKQKKQVSYDSGVTWVDVSPAEYQRGVLYEPNSQDCGYMGEFERWVNSGTTCDGYDKYYLQVKQTSNDMVNWITTSETQKGELIEKNSTDCGFVPTGNFKLYATYSDSSDYTVNCNSSTTLTTTETRGHSTPNTAMTTAIVGDCVTEIGDYSFRGCSGLTSIVLNNGITSIGDWAFGYCSGVTSINIPSGVTNIGIYAFRYWSSLTSIDIPSGVTSINEGVFEGCSGLTSINIPSGVTSIGDNAFRYCSNLASLTIPSGITSIGYWAFGNCSGLTSINIPSGVTSILDETFYGCSSLTSITIPSGVTSIGYDAFYGCSSLTSVDIPSRVRNIDGYAFSECTSLTSITVNATTPPSLSSNAFENTNNCPIYVPASSVNTYKSAISWNVYSSRIQAIPT